jgi:hypothetical protein
MKTELKLAAAWLILSTLNPQLSSSFAATNLVYNNNDHSAGSLRQAIHDSSSGDTLIFSNVVAGSILLTSGELLISNKDLTILGPGAGVLAVDGNNASRVFHITNGIVSISGLAITNGDAGIYYAGGGIYNDHGTLTLSNCTISGNLGSLEGGGIENLGGGYGAATLSLIGCTVSGNVALPLIDGSYGYGGGICNAGRGGGSATLSVLASTFNGNLATNVSGSWRGLGAAIYSDGTSGGSATVSVSASTFSGNFAAVGGGIASTASGGTGSVSVVGCTFSGNSAIVDAGCIYNASGSELTIADTILKAGTHGANLINNLGTVTSLGYNLSSDNGGGFLTAMGDQSNTEPMLGPLQDNGGPTQTIAPLVGSPAIDQGKSFGLTADQRGRLRPFDFPGVPNAIGGDGSDIGSVELNPASLVVVNTNDNGPGSLRQAILDASPADDDTISFASGLTGTITLTTGELGIGKSLSVAGPGANVLAISGNSAGRVFDIGYGAVVISGLTIRDGRVLGATGRPGQTVAAGGIFCEQGATLALTDCVISNCTAIGGHGSSVLVSGNGGDGGVGYGGGIRNDGMLTLERCLLANNQALGGSGGNSGIVAGNHGGNGGHGIGGGIYSEMGGLILRGCTLSGNRATFGNAGGGSIPGANGTAWAAGLNAYAGTSTLINCTIAGNVVNGAGTGVGGGIYCGGSGAGLLSCTVAGNNGDSSGGGLYGSNAGVTNCIIADNNAAGSPDVFGSETSGGYNLIGNTSGSSGFGAVGDQLNVNPMLSSLQANGGPTPTMALLPGSPAIDKGKSFGLTTDQRGLPRPFVFPSIPEPSGGDGSDIGAFEVSPPILNIALAAPTNVVLSWLAYDSSFRLQAVTHLPASSNWTAVSGTPALIGNQYYLTNPANAPARFYRLVAP